MDDTIYLSKMNSSAVNMNDDCMGAFFKIGGFTANSPGFVGTNVSTNLVIFCTTKKNKSGVNLVEIFEPVSTVQTVKRVHGQCILCRMIDHVHHFDIYIYILYIYIGCLIPLPAVKDT